MPQKYPENPSKARRSSKRLRHVGRWGIKPTHAGWANEDMDCTKNRSSSVQECVFGPTSWWLLDQFMVVTAARKQWSLVWPLGLSWRIHVDLCHVVGCLHKRKRTPQKDSENVQFIIVLESDLQFVCIFLVIWTYPNSTHFAHPHLSQTMPHHRYPQGYNRLPPPSCPSNLPPPTNILLEGSSQESLSWCSLQFEVGYTLVN